MRLFLPVAIFLCCSVGYIASFHVVSPMSSHASKRRRCSEGHSVEKRRLVAVKPAPHALGTSMTGEACTDSSSHPTPSSPFFIREAHFADIGPASEILTAGFFADSTNIFTYPLERLKTLLSLESTFQRTQHHAHGEMQHSMLVACRSMDKSVIAFCEVDGTTTKQVDAAPRPYMCNLAVDKSWRRVGIARALIDACEKKVIGWRGKKVFLRVKQKNSAAITLYESLGYRVVSCQNGQTESILLLMKELASDVMSENKTLRGSTECDSFRIQSKTISCEGASVGRSSGS